MLVAIVTIIISVIVVFNHQLVWLLAVFPGLYIAYVFLLLHTKAPTLREGFYLTETEKEVWKMHHVAIRFPFAARTRAGALSALQFISIILAIALVVAGAYWGLAFALGWFILAPLTTRTNPIIPYSNAAQRGNLNATKRLEALKSLEVKLKSPGKHAKAKASERTNSPDAYGTILQGVTIRIVNDLQEKLGIEKFKELFIADTFSVLGINIDPRILKASINVLALNIVIPIVIKINVLKL